MCTLSLCLHPLPPHTHVVLWISLIGARLHSQAVIFIWGAVMVAWGSWVVIRVGCRDMVVVGGVVGLLLWCDMVLSLSRSAVVVGGG
jgi:hypothetical protein